MGISYEPSISQQLGAQNIQTFVEGINHIIDPNYAFKQEMKKALATNPNLAQSLADTEHSSPGFLEKLGLGDVGKTVSSIPESSNAQFARLNREQILAQKKGALNLEGQKQGLEGIDVEGMIKEMQNANPEERANIARKHLGIESIDQERKVKAEATSAEAKASVADQLAKNEADISNREATQARVANSMLSDVLAKNPDLSKIDFGQIVDDLVTKHKGPSPELFQIPGFNEGFQASLRAKELEEARKNRLQIKELSQKETVDKKAESAAYSDLVKTGVGSYNAWLQVHQDPTIIDKVQKKEDAGVELTPDEEGILEIAAHRNEQQDIRMQKELHNLNTDVIKAQNSIGEAFKHGDSPAAIQGSVGALNIALRARNTRTGTNYEARLGPVPDVGSNKPGSRFLGMGTAKAGLYYIDKSTGKRIPDEDVTRDLQSTTPKPNSPQTEKAAGPKTESFVTPGLSEWYQKYTADTNQQSKQSAIAALKNSNPSAYNELKAKGKL